MLPRHVMVVVMEHLSVRDLGACLSVCPAWKKMASTNELWRLLMASYLHYHHHHGHHCSAFPTPCHDLSSSLPPDWKSIVKREATSVVRYHSNHDLHNIKLPRDRLIKLIMIGDAGVGKSCFLSQLIGDSARPYSTEHIPTKGIDFARKMCLYKREVIKLQIWDTSGRQLPKHGYRMGGGNGVLVMFSVGNRQSFDNVTGWLKQVDQDFNNIVLVGLKADLEGHQRVVGTQEAEALAQRLGMCYTECSAKSEEGVEDAVSLVTRAAVEDQILTQIPTQVPKSNRGREALVRYKKWLHMPKLRRRACNL